MKLQSDLRALTVRLCALAALSTACMDGQKSLRYGPAELSHAGLNVVAVAGEVLFDSDVLAMPGDIAIVGERLVVIDVVADSAIHLLNRVTGESIRSFGRRGAGPGEFETAWSVDPVPGSASECWIYDVGLGRLTFVDLNDDFFDAAALGERIINLGGNAQSLGPVRTADANISLSLGMYTGGRLGVYDAQGALLETVASLPPGAADIPPNVRQHAYQATLIPHPNRRLFAAVTRHASLIEIFGVDGSRITTAKGPLHVEPTYQVRQGEEGKALLATGQDLRFGYLDGSASRDYVFALFSGRTREGAMGRHYMGRFVHVFDWAGNFVKAIELDADVVTIAVDETSSVLYAVRHDPYPAILRYSLTDVLERGSRDRTLADD